MFPAHNVTKSCAVSPVFDLHFKGLFVVIVDIYILPLILHYITDAMFGVFSYIPNLLFKFGLHPGDKLEEWLGNLIAIKTGCPDTTFCQVSSYLYQCTYILCLCVEMELRRE